MNAHLRTIYETPAEPLTRFTELAVVRLVRAVEDDEGRMIEAGSRGTIVATWGEGVAYEVEFVQPFQALATVDTVDLEPLPAE